MNEPVATGCFLVRVAGGDPVDRLRAIPQVVEVLAVKDGPTGRDEIPVTVRLQRQREIIHARREEFGRFLKPKRLRLVSSRDL
jgi:hypothetical protein